jgi:hypothetical protein
MGLADRDYYREHTQELDRQAEASASRFGGGGRRTVVIDANGTLGPEPTRLRWWWQTLCWCGILTLLYFGFRHFELKREVDRLQRAQAEMQAQQNAPPTAKKPAPPRVDFFK